MKTIIKIAIWSLVALVAVGLTACKKGLLSNLRADSLENTAWSLEQQFHYDETKKEWYVTATLFKYNPFYLINFIEGRCNGITATSAYEIDVKKRVLNLISEGEGTLIALSADRLMIEWNIDGLMRSSYKRIPSLKRENLYGKWLITSLQKSDGLHDWEDTGYEVGYWIQFDNDGSFRNSRNGKKDYNVNGNILNINLIYGRSFVVELTDEKLVFIHNYNGTGDHFMKETFHGVTE